MVQNPTFRQGLLSAESSFPGVGGGDTHLASRRRWVECWGMEDGAPQG